MRRGLMLIALAGLLLPATGWSQFPGRSGSSDGRSRFSRFGRQPGTGGPTAPGSPAPSSPTSPGSGGPGSGSGGPGSGGPRFGGPGSGGPGSGGSFPGRGFSKDGGPGGAPSSSPSESRQLFEQYSKDGNVVRREDLPPQLHSMFDRAAAQFNITNGQMNRQQFDELMRGMQALRQSMDSDGSARYAEDAFRRSDRNGDGLLNFDEMSEALRDERDKWDVNRDGFIDLTEYVPYIQARIQQRNQERADQERRSDSARRDDDDDRPLQEEEKKPTVYRAGKLPKELPSWFSEYDRDADAQVGLYEWKNSGKSFDEFRTYDLNDDGFVTVAELLRYNNQQKARASNGSVASSGGGNGGSGSSRSGLGNIFGMFGRRSSDSSGSASGSASSGPSRFGSRSR